MKNDYFAGMWKK